MLTLHLLTFPLCTRLMSDILVSKSKVQVLLRTEPPVLLIAHTSSYLLVTSTLLSLQNNLLRTSVLCPVQCRSVQLHGWTSSRFTRPVLILVAPSIPVQPLQCTSPEHQNSSQTELTEYGNNRAPNQALAWPAQIPLPAYMHGLLEKTAVQRSAANRRPTALRGSYHCRHKVRYGSPLSSRCARPWPGWSWSWSLLLGGIAQGAEVSLSYRSKVLPPWSATPRFSSRLGKKHGPRPGCMLADACCLIITRGITIMDGQCGDRVQEKEGKR